MLYEVMNLAGVWNCRDYVCETSLYGYTHYSETTRATSWHAELHLECTRKAGWAGCSNGNTQQIDVTPKRRCVPSIADRRQTRIAEYYLSRSLSCPNTSRHFTLACLQCSRVQDVDAWFPNSACIRKDCFSQT